MRADYRVEVVDDEPVCLDDPRNFGSVVILDCEDELVDHGVRRVSFPRKHFVVCGFFEADVEPLELPQKHHELAAYLLLQLDSLLSLDLCFRKLLISEYLSIERLRPDLLQLVDWGLSACLRMTFVEDPELDRQRLIVDQTVVVFLSDAELEGKSRKVFSV